MVDRTSGVLLAGSMPAPLDTFLPNCFITNSTAETIPAFSVAKVISTSIENNADPGPMKHAVSVVVGKCDGTEASPLVSTGAFQIPAGETRPGYIGSLLPLATAGAAGARFAPEDGNWAVAANDAGPLMLVDPGKNGVGLFLYGGSGGAVQPKIRFKVKDKMVNRSTTVFVDKIVGNALQPGTFTPLALGDEVAVHDPQNLWSQVEPDALGWAFWREFPYGPESDDPANVPRWEIEECSLPVDELRGYLTDCMGKCDASATVTILDPKVASSTARPAEVDTECNSDNGPQWHAIRSGYANSDQGPNVTFSSGTANLTAWNRHKLDGMKGSSVVLKRVTNRFYSEPDNVESPLSRSDTSYEYEIVLVERRKARWIFGTWADSGSHQIDKYWDGDNPEDCGSVTITSLVGLECPLDGEKFVACFDPEADQYYLISTQSAWLGPPETVQAIATESESTSGLAGFEANGCDVKLTYDIYKFKAWPCDLGGDTGEAILPTQEVALGTCIETQGYNLYLNRSMICVLGVDTAAPCVIEGDACDDDPECNYYSGA